MTCVSPQACEPLWPESIPTWCPGHRRASPWTSAPHLLVELVLERGDEGALPPRLSQACTGWSRRRVWQHRQPPEHGL